MRLNFHQQLDTLKAQLLSMAHQVDRSFADSIEAYNRLDLDLSQRVIGAEVQINGMDREVDRAAIELLALEQPTAIDLRFILAVMRINSDLERIGDQAVNIAERVHNLQELSPADLGVNIPLLASHARTMFKIALQAFRDSDAVLADQVLTMDDKVDALNGETFRALSQIIGQQPELANHALNTLLIARNIERVADHATNIAEDVIFWRRGDDVRHNAGIPA